MAPRKTSVADPLIATAERLTKLASARPQVRFLALADQAQVVKTAMATARQDAVLAWVDDLTASGKMSRAEAVSTIMEKAHLSRTGVFTVLLAAERRAGRPKLAPGRPTRAQSVAKRPASSAAGARVSHKGHDHPATQSGREMCRRALRAA